MENQTTSKKKNFETPSTPPPLIQALLGLVIVILFIFYAKPFGQSDDEVDITAASTSIIENYTLEPNITRIERTVGEEFVRELRKLSNVGHHYSVGDRVFLQDLLRGRIIGDKLRFILESLEEMIVLNDYLSQTDEPADCEVATEMLMSIISKIARIPIESYRNDNSRLYAALRSKLIVHCPEAEATLFQKESEVLYPLFKDTLSLEELAELHKGILNPPNAGIKIIHL